MVFLGLGSLCLQLQSIWLIKRKELFYFTILINFLSVIFIFILMGLETILTNHHTFEWPFRNPLNGPFIHRIGILFFSAAFLILFSKLKHKTKALFFILISIFFLCFQVIEQEAFHL